MKNNKYYYLLAVLMMAVAFLATWQMRINAQAEGKAIQISLTTDKDNHALGELIGLKFDVKNMSGESLEVKQPSVRTGNLRLFISSDGRRYVEYVGPNWGSLDSKRQQMQLGAGESFEDKATLLYNRRIPTAHLTPMYADKIRKERVDTEFAFLEAGHYWLKATYTNGKDTFRSDAIEIDVTLPVGSDAVVWEQIKTDGAFAYFLHTGEVKYMPGSEESQVFVEKLRSITADYPNTNFSERLSEGLVKYNRNLEYVQRLKAERQAAN